MGPPSASTVKFRLGSFQKKQMKFVEAWVALHEDELKASWIALNENGEIVKIRGLE
jgi:hypothetical protein